MLNMDGQHKGADMSDQDFKTTTRPANRVTRAGPLAIMGAGTNDHRPIQ